MNLESDKRLNIQLRLDFSSAPTGEARQAGREDIESLSAVHEPERPANTCSKRVSATSRTAVYGAVRTVVWEGRSCEAPPYPDLSDFVPWPRLRHSDCSRKCPLFEEDRKQSEETQNDANDPTRTSVEFRLRSGCQFIGPKTEKVRSA